MILVSLAAVFGFTMIAGLFLKNTQVLTIGWVGFAFFFIIFFILIKADEKKNPRR